MIRLRLRAAFSALLGRPTIAFVHLRKVELAGPALVIGCEIEPQEAASD